MTYLDHFATWFAARDDWTGRTYGELRQAIESALVTTQATLNPSDEIDEYMFWIEKCRHEVDYLFYILYCNITLGIVDEPDKTVRDIAIELEDLPMGTETKRNLFVCYLNTYLYRYIMLEYDNLSSYISANDHLEIVEIVDLFITRLLYEDFCIDFERDNPNIGITYMSFNDEDISQQRKDSLRSIRDSLVSDVSLSNLSSIFKNIFYLMTFFCWDKIPPRPWCHYGDSQFSRYVRIQTIVL